MTDRPPDDDFTPISPNPFIVGNPVRDRAMFFGREAEFELVRKRFEQSAHGMLLVFCGERRSGKTSILFQILDQRLGPGFIPVLIDMQSMAVENEIAFLTRIAEDVLAALDENAPGVALPTFTPDSNHAATFQRFIRDVLRARPGQKLVLLFDEYELFENKIDANQLGHDVLLILANLMENERVFLIFTGSQHLEQRRREYWEKFLPKSHFKMISFLERADALNLIRKPVEGRVGYGEGTVDAIYRLTAGQPFYTQAICQSLVDQLNERHTNDATPPIVDEVVDGLVNNPLPQMIFLWDALEGDEKLALALLAESLTDENDHAGVAELARLLRTRRYPLTLDQARIAITLEKLFKSEMLLREDRASLREYAFRMDLWRRWIHRQHSVWQVMRELGIEIRPGLGRLSLAWRIAIGGGVAVAVIAIALGVVASRRDRRAPDSRLGSAFYALRVQPEDAMISLDGRPMGSGTFLEWITADQDHYFRLSADGYVDSEFVVRHGAGESVNRQVQLRALLGMLRIETQPPGADITVDGVRLGASLAYARLQVFTFHEVEATLKDYSPRRVRHLVVPGYSTLRLSLIHQGDAGSVEVTSAPPASRIWLDGRPRGVTPINLPVEFGSRTFRASREGYDDVETTLVVNQGTREVHLVLSVEPQGTLEIRGDRPATQFLIDGRFVTGGVQNSGLRSVPPGSHDISVVLRSGNVDTTLTVAAREHVTFDFTSKTVTRRREGTP